MRKIGPNKIDSLGGPILVGIAAILTLLVTIVFIVGRSRLIHATPPTAIGNEIIIGLLAVACYFPAASFFSLGIIRWATPLQHRESSRRQERIEATLQTISKNLSLSEPARQILFRSSDQKAISKTIERVSAKSTRPTSRTLSS